MTARRGVCFFTHVDHIDSLKVDCMWYLVCSPVSKAQRGMTGFLPTEMNMLIVSQHLQGNWNFTLFIVCFDSLLKDTFVP